ncbi:hypothetical protein U1Q18_015785 [Sarracenia purpurea var. burkii]
MSIPSSSVTRKTGEGVSDHFPAGLRVLVVDDDQTCLVILERMLQKCLYEVTKCNRAEIALSLLREKKNGFDIVISDVHMPDMDGFKLLECIGLEMDLPVIMMSADDSKNVVMKGVTHGACDYLIKPVRIEALKNIWQHVVRKRKQEWKDFEQSGSIEDGERQQKPLEDADFSSSANEGNWRSSKRRKDEEDQLEERDDSSSLKKPRVVWSVELHQQFVAAVNQLGIDKAVPKKILELMNVPGLTRENVASHLQKYRLYLRRLSGVSQHPSGLNNSFIGTSETTAFGSISSLNGLDLQAFAATGQLPAQSLTTLEAAASLGRSTAKSGISMPFIDQRNNLFSFENPKLRLREGQQPQLSNNNNINSNNKNNNNNQQISLLHGIPTNMGQKQLANLHQSAQQPFRGANMQINNPHGSQGSSLMVQMSQPQPRTQIFNDSNSNHFSRLPSSIVQPSLSNGIMANGVLARNGMGENARGAAYNSVSQASTMVDFSINQNTEEVNSEIKGLRGFAYDIFSELQQHKSHDWDFPNVGLAFNTSSQHSNMQGGSSLDVPQSVLIHQGFSSSRNNNVQNRNTCISKVMFSVGEESGQRNAPNIGQQFDTLLADNSLRGVKAESLPEASCQNTLFHEQFSQEELMSVLFKQQEGIGAITNEFGFDGYPLDNLPV